MRPMRRLGNDKGTQMSTKKEIAAARARLEKALRMARKQEKERREELPRSVVERAADTESAHGQKTIQWTH